MKRYKCLTDGEGLCWRMVEDPAGEYVRHDAVVAEILAQKDLRADRDLLAKKSESLRLKVGLHYDEIRRLSRELEAWMNRAMEAEAKAAEQPAQPPVEPVLGDDPKSVYSRWGKVLDRIRKMGAPCRTETEEALLQVGSEAMALEANLFRICRDLEDERAKYRQVDQDFYACMFALGLPIPEGRGSLLSDGTQPRNVRMEVLHKQLCHAESEVSSLRYALSQARDEAERFKRINASANNDLARLYARKEELERDLAAFRRVLGDVPNLAERVANLERDVLRAFNLWSEPRPSREKAEG